MTCSPCKGSLRSSVRAIILCVQLRAHPAAVSGLTGCGSFLLLLSVCPPSSSLHAGPMSFYGAHPFLLLYVLSSTLLSGHLGPDGSHSGGSRALTVAVSLGVRRAQVMLLVIPSVIAGKR